MLGDVKGSSERFTLPAWLACVLGQLATASLCENFIALVVFVMFVLAGGNGSM